MTKAFIVRPFNVKNGVDFEKVDRDLIQPALAQLELKGSTTGEIVAQGNIREDMFAQLLLADLVIADISIHNANVFYELGIRHAFRDKMTFLIRCSVPDHDVPFDLKTDRYLSYKSDNPGDCVEKLVAGIKATLQENKADSPVFSMLPALQSQDPERFVIVPEDFAEEVKLAVAGKQIGKLALLAAEVNGFAWETPAMRLLGEALFKLKDFEAAGICWEKVRNRWYYDIEANDRLATIYQRLSEDELQRDREAGLELLTKSDIAIERLLKSYEKLEAAKRAEVYALKGRNAKTRWLDTWKNSSAEQKPQHALQSTFLLDAYAGYDKAYTEDLNHFYSGINALGLVTTILSLAERLPDTFTNEYASEDEAALALRNFTNRQQTLAILVQAGIEAERKRNPDKVDVWVDLTEADLACLTSTKPMRVGNLYKKVIQVATDQNLDSGRRQLEIYDQLGVVPDNVKAALIAFNEGNLVAASTKPHYLLFTGHMIDKEGREKPRFPKGLVDKASAAITAQVLEAKEKYGDRLKGIAGGACGGDILFHEACRRLGIPTELYLALPREQFIVESVEFAGTQWVERFDELFKTLPKKVLSKTKALPKWLQRKQDYSIWERNNLWMLNSALVCSGINMSLIALWDGKGGDAAGGTEHMVKEAKARGAKTSIIDVTMLEKV